jgi:hypothetical protein
MVEAYGTDELYKTTDSGNRWTLMYDSGIDNDFTIIDFVAINTTSTIEIPLLNPNKKLEKIVEVLGRETPFKPNTPLLHMYDDGAVERKVVFK